MYQKAYNGYNSYKANQYLVKNILEATPQQLLLKVFDYAIVNCQKQNIIKTNRAIQELINGLRYETDEMKEISIGLLRLYQYCQDQVRAKNFEMALKILTELRETWQSIFK